MGHIACFLNRSITDSFSPVFETIYVTEILLLVCNLFLLPIVAWITVNGVPLHRNLRYVMTLAIFHCWIGVIARGVLLGGQLFDTGSTGWLFALTWASFFRRLFFMFFGAMFFGITTERLVATLWWSWYERQGHGTILVLVIISFAIEVAAIQFAYVETFAESGTFENASIVFIVFAIIFVASGVVYICLFAFNMREVAKLSRQGANEYSLARVYQLKENVTVMMMILRSLAPLTIICSPSFFFIGGFIFLSPQFIFLRPFAVAMFDLWIGIATLLAAFIFPLVDSRFGRPAFRLRIYRLLIPARFHPDFIEHVTGNQVAPSEQYFDWLNRDLNGNHRNIR